MAGDWRSSLLLHKVHCRTVVTENEVQIQVYQTCSANRNIVIHRVIIICELQDFYEKSSKNIVTFKICRKKNR